MRTIFAVVLLGSGLVLNVCDKPTTITYDNKTAHALCVYQSESPDRPEPKDCEPVEPNQRIVFLGPVCSGDEPIEVRITIRPDGDELYSKLATCAEWGRTAVVTIQQRGDKLVATDTITQTPSPSNCPVSRK